MIISLTFDDGFKRHYELAKLLYRLDIRGSFYIITGLRRYEGEKLLINEPRMIKEMHDMGHEIGSHTHTHRNLTTLDEGSIEKECLLSSKTLERILGHKPLGLAYPYGACNGKVAGIVGRYFKYAKEMGRHNRWSESLDPYRIGSMGIRHLPKLPFKALHSDVKLVVLTFHDEKLKTVMLVARLLRDLGLKVMPLGEALRSLGVI